MLSHNCSPTVLLICEHTTMKEEKNNEEKQKNTTKWVILFLFYPMIQVISQTNDFKNMHTWTKRMRSRGEKINLAFNLTCCLPAYLLAFHVWLSIENHFVLFICCFEQRTTSMVLSSNTYFCFWSCLFVDDV